MGKHSAGGSNRRAAPRSNGSDAATRRSSAGARRQARPDTRANGAASNPSSRASVEGQLSPAVAKERRRRRRVRIAAIVGGTFLAALLVSAGWAWAWMNSVNDDMQASAPRAILKKALSKPEPKKPFNMLLLGADLRHGDTAWRADTIILAKVDPENQKVWLLSIPRDTRAEIPGHGVEKINAAHLLGGPSLMVESVEQLTGEQINHYLEVDFSGFKKVVNGLGGVWIDVDQEINDRRAASHNPDRRASHIDVGYQKLDGEHALTFVRSRDFADGDFTRMKNQQKFFKAIAKQAAEPTNIIRIPSIVGDVAKVTTTDMTVQELLSLAQSLRGIDGDAIETATLEGEWRTPYVWTDEERKAELLSAMREGRSFDSTPTASSGDVAVAEVDPANVTVAVRNGAGIQGVAAETGTKLESEGFVVQEVGNVRNGDFPETLVIYRQSESAAKAVAATLPAAQVIPAGGQYVFPTEVLVVIGRDWEE